MQLLEEVRSAWGWVGIEPVDLIDENDFGNLILKDVRGKYWRLCPEDLYCQVVASSRDELDQLAKDQEFLRDWYMRGVVDQAFQRLGALAPGRKYYLKIPGALGGEYGGDNLGTISFDELIRASGHIAQQIAELPDGASVKLSVTD
ncbi:T6SS immunity protein Tdi1 domain-containing protein [Massilia sp. BSC265]|uniref:T6SS immunity protein Tdi1 domain-containing protein n=1 Tax=Massilia sp. BSC265 TaxID=1549812 RepID=UPI0004E8C8CB|nr:T6SS immunity protein Tdi1 domain-containing protein [Massilia sp. BSC265]KFI08886.1 hypothetical protein JN27_01695 [Massilia sp. BSC265]